MCRRLRGFWSWLFGLDHGLLALFAQCIVDMIDIGLCERFVGVFVSGVVYI